MTAGKISGSVRETHSIVEVYRIIGQGSRVEIQGCVDRYATVGYDVCAVLIREGGIDGNTVGIKNEVVGVGRRIDQERVVVKGRRIIKGKPGCNIYGASIECTAVAGAVGIQQ
jgi:hypothetical protein